MNSRALLRHAVAVLMCLVSVGVTASAETMLMPPKILVIQREVVKPGKAHAHSLVEAQWAQAYKDAKMSHWMGMTSLSGETRALFLRGYDSEAAWAAQSASVEKNAALAAKSAALAEKDSDILSNFRQSVFLFKPELSYRADSIAVAGLRYWKITTIRLKFGYADEFAEIRKIVKAAHEKANLQESYVVYHLLEGGDGMDTYLIMIPMQTLAEDDATDTLHGDAYHKALPDDWKATNSKFVREAATGVETHLFAIDPNMSVPRKEWMEADKFWDTKTMAKPTAKAKAAAAEAPKP